MVFLLRKELNITHTPIYFLRIIYEEDYHHYFSKELNFSTKNAFNVYCVNQTTWIPYQKEIFAYKISNYSKDNEEIKEGLLYYGRLFHFNNGRSFIVKDLTYSSYSYMNLKIVKIEDGLFYSNERKEYFFDYEITELNSITQTRRVYLYSNRTILITKIWEKVYNIIAKALFLMILLYYLLKPFVNWTAEYFYLVEIYHSHIKHSDKQIEFNKINYCSFIINKMAFGFLFSHAKSLANEIKEFLSIEKLKAIYPQYSDSSNMEVK